MQRENKEKRKEFIFGVDMAHRGNPSGVGILNLQDRRLKLHKITLSEILSKIRDKRPDLLVIDAPLSLPEKGESWRTCEEKLIKRGFHPLPLTLPSMRELSLAGRLLKEKAEKFVKHVFETFPAASFRILGIKKKPKTKKERRKVVMKLSKLYQLEIKREILSEDELDAFICCLAGFSWIKGNYTEISAENCRLILVGKPKC